MTFCQEYDSTSKVFNFGPMSKMMWLTKKRLGIAPGNISEAVVTRAIPNGYFINPAVTGHSGLDISLYGWPLPKNALTFSVFRDPLQRLVSSFHYGITFGAGRPGQVTQCDLPVATNGTAKIPWAKQIVQARMLQSMFRNYLRACPVPTDNAYTGFLDPLHRNLTTALRNLENHVIVGLQDDIDNSLQRWINITLNTCLSHPSFAQLEKLLENQDTVGVLNPSLSRMNSVDLVVPAIETFDDDLKEMIRKYTKEDEVIYKRAVELYKL